MEVVKNFTAFLQANFTAITAQELIAFPEELENTRAYLGVEQVLLEDRLQVAYDTPFTAFRLPPMTLQPVVENAVRYGVKGRKEPGRITIRSFSAEDAAVVTVEDDGPGFDPDTLDGSGHVGLLIGLPYLAFIYADLLAAFVIADSIFISVRNNRYI